MFWSAALDLKTQRPTPRPSYGSFSRVSSTSSFRIPQSIPEHQPVSQFTSPVPARIEEYFEQPDTVVARTRASLQLSEHTQTALKLLLQGERDAKSKSSLTLPTISNQPKWNRDIKTKSKSSSYSARRTPLQEAPDRTPLLKPLGRTCDQEEPNPQENSTEHNYWMQELERRRAGIKKSRRRTCITMSERATTSSLKVGVVMCSVPLILVLGFVLFVMLFGDGSDMSRNVMSVMNNLPGFGSGRDKTDFIFENHDIDDRDRGRIAKAFALPLKKNQLEEESAVLTLVASTDQTWLRGSRKDDAGGELRE